MLIFMIKKYNNMQNKSGDQLAKFFTDIYNYFFRLLHHFGGLRESAFIPNNVTLANLLRFSVSPIVDF